MTYYILAFLIYYAVSVYVLQSGARHQRLIFFIGFLPLISIVLMRGSIGTDTASYMHIISDIRDTGSTGVEIGFIYFVKTMLFCGLKPEIILVLIAITTTALLVYASMLSERAFLVFLLCIVPIFYLDMTMNGLRYGLSFACASLSIAFLYRNKLSLGIFWGVCAVIFHISGLILLGMNLLLADDKKELIHWLKLLLGFLMVVLLQQLSSVGGANSIGGTNIENKAVAYLHIPSPNLYSGLAPLIMSLIVLWVIKMGDERNLNNIKVISRRFYILLSLVIITFFIAKFSYAGIRLQFLVLFGMLVLIQSKPKFAGVFSIKVNKNMIFIMMFVGCVGVASFLKNAYLGAGQGESPWAPYKLNPYFCN